MKRKMIVATAAAVVAAAGGASVGYTAAQRIVQLQNGDGAIVGRKVACAVVKNGITCGLISRKGYQATVGPDGVVVLRGKKIVEIWLHDFAR